MIHANRIVPRFLLSAILAMIMTFFLLSVLGAVADTARIMRLDSNFAFVSAITRTGGNIPAAMPIPDANRFYSEDIATWRKIIDKLGSP